MAGFEPTTLRTDRLILRPPGAGDADDKFAAVDDEVRQWMAWAVDYDRDKALRWCTEEAFRDPQREVNFVIEPSETGRFAGLIGIGRADWDTGVAETGYWIGPSARRRGYVAEALRAVAGHAFGLGLYRLELLAAVGNLASQRVAERVEFHPGGRAPQGAARARGPRGHGALQPAPGGPVRLIGVGVGPGDPELVTVKAVRVLREADLVLVPVMAPDEQGRAEAVVRAHVDAAERVVFALNDRGGVTERRANAWDAAARRVVGAFAEGAGTVAFATIGDPNLYSTFTYLAQSVRGHSPDVVVETVPGVTAMQDLAARSGTVLAEGNESLRLLPLTGGTRSDTGLRDALATGDTVVAYKFGQVAGRGARRGRRRGPAGRRGVRRAARPARRGRPAGRRDRRPGAVPVHPDRSRAAYAPGRKAAERP